MPVSLTFLGGAGTVHVHEPTHAAPFAHGAAVALKVNPAKAHVVGRDA